MFLDESMTLRFFEIQSKLKPKCIIEVGAFDAEFTREMFNRGMGNEFWAFEASASVFKRFKELCSHIDYVNMAISDFTGKVEFQVQLDQDAAANGSNSILTRAENKEYRFEEVDCSSLDDFFGSREDVCLWIDCEGANREVLSGANRILDIGVQSIFIETEHKLYWKSQWLHLDVLRFLRSKGFSLLYTSMQYVEQSNCIFVRDELLAEICN